MGAVGRACDRTARRRGQGVQRRRGAPLPAPTGIGAVIPRKSNERPNGQFDHQAYRERKVVELLINRLEQHRRVATRYEKRAANYYRAMLTRACILLWL